MIIRNEAERRERLRDNIPVEWFASILIFFSFFFPQKIFSEKYFSMYQETPV